ncbi:hypothetical protein S40293_03986 [Stachybotrys chartarum IBT 40293]|nr:hypothetical protein S40293_03986 [Stachybotrys chartarum IBT 40293]
MTTYEKLRWRETEPGVWSKDEDEIEQFYSTIARLYSGSGRVFFAITGHLSLRVEANSSGQTITNQDVDKALQLGWLALRRSHPTIASYSEFDPSTGKFTKFYRSDEDGWLEKTLVPVSNGQTGVEFANSDPPVPKLPTLFVITPPASDDTTIRRDLVLRSHHDILDGIGTLMLFNNLVAHAAEALRLGDAFRVEEVDKAKIEQRLSPSYRIAAEVPEVHTEAMKKRLARLAAAAEADEKREKVEIVGVPFKRGAEVPGKHQRVELELSPEQTSRVLSAAKQLGATVTHIYHAAIALAIRKLQTQTDEDRPVQYLLYLLRNERANCRPPYNGHEHPAALYHSVSGEKLIVDMVVPQKGTVANEAAEKEEFLRILKEMRDFYNTVRDDTEHAAVAPDLWAKGIPKLPKEEDSSQPLPVPPPDLAPQASISSMGKIDRVLAERADAFEVHNPWVTGEELRSFLGLFLGTFRGTLALSAAYNDAWHDEQGAVEFLKRTHAVVERGLGV